MRRKGGTLLLLEHNMRIFFPSLLEREENIPFTSHKLGVEMRWEKQEK
jgi:hypothetical protein